MQTLSKFLSYKIKTIAIVDSSSSGPEVTLPYWDAEIAGFSTVHVPQELQTIPEIVAFIQEHAQAAICSHRLGSYQAPLFYGAELAASLYDAGIPTLLVTQYLEIDQHSSIRRWRDKLPVVLHLREFDFSTLRHYLDLCVSELQGHIPDSRIPYRVMVGVEHVEGVAGDQYVDVSIDYWDRYQRIRMPIEVFPAELRDQIEPGTWLFAMVNVGAQFAHELYFRDFTLAPEPQFDESLTYCVNVLDDINESENPFLWFEKQQVYAHQLEIEVFGASKDLYN
ncbi:hypothetical protein [Dictyobacter formicarum]|uniref:Uncharacterized protein n=1 Tax=Dictyobacter formicarum TaxID=2778368 RepID=A0ABQ3VUF9_9CHLR|nr:hypothetical protein [Dictyobacter formicarum]GHO88946.1 hypothetical protein KSZ_69520 [Dictyobacter formicarum]